MKLLPIEKEIKDNPRFANEPACEETFLMTISFYEKVGFHSPWICYYAEIDGELVGSAGFKGRPVNNTVEIAYGTFDKYRQKGIGSLICNALVKTALDNEPGLRITARTLPEKNYSTRILEKNNFIYVGVEMDPEDGQVWEWEYVV
jgi:RimJ/RimL family protein N-acetyltransferase